jgi:hypothetical protein
MTIITWPRKRDHIGEELEAALDLAVSDNRTILDRAASATTNMLDSALAEETRLVGMIDNLMEELRQTRAVIEAFSPVTEKLVAASDPTPVKAKAKKPVAIAAE